MLLYVVGRRPGRAPLPSSNAFPRTPLHPKQDGQSTIHQWYVLQQNISIGLTFRSAVLNRAIVFPWNYQVPGADANCELKGPSIIDEPWANKCNEASRLPFLSSSWWHYLQNKRYHRIGTQSAQNWIHRIMIYINERPLWVVEPSSHLQLFLTPRPAVTATIHVQIISSPTNRDRILFTNINLHTYRRRNTLPV